MLNTMNHAKWRARLAQMWAKENKGEIKNAAHLTLYFKNNSGIAIKREN